MTKAGSSIRLLHRRTESLDAALLNKYATGALRPQLTLLLPSDDDDGGSACSFLLRIRAAAAARRTDGALTAV
eukprot:6189111-Pleurochrysis_carterae.AAC.2